MNVHFHGPSPLPLWKDFCVCKCGNAYRMHGQKGGRSSEYVSAGVSIECTGTAVEGVLGM